MWLGKLTALDMTPLGWLGRKTSTQTNNPCPAEPGYSLHLQTVYIQISWLLKKPTDLDLNCLSFGMWIYIKNPDQVIWLAETWKWVWHLNLFSMTSVKRFGNKPAWVTLIRDHKLDIFSWISTWKVQGLNLSPFFLGLVSVNQWRYCYITLSLLYTIML